MSFRPAFTTGLLGLALLAAPAAQADQNLPLGSTYTDFTQWTLLGSAQASNTTPGNGFSYSDLILTSVGGSGQAGAGWAPTALAWDFNQAFHVDFHFFIPTNPELRGDGLAFVLAGATGLGGTGSGLGYEGLAGPSVAFAIDTFHFGPDPDTGLGGEAVSPSLQILRDGSVTPLAFTETGLGDDIRDDAAHTRYQWWVNIDYTPSGNGDQSGLLVGSISELNLGSFSVQAQVDFSALAGAPVFYGFTAANGAASDGHYATSAMAVPEPANWALMGSGLLMLLMLARRTQQSRR